MVGRRRHAEQLLLRQRHQGCQRGALQDAWPEALLLDLGQSTAGGRVAAGRTALFQAARSA